MDRHAVLAAAGPAQRFAVPPEPAKTGDGNEWVTGRCWLYCLRDGVQVIWIGPVQVVDGRPPPRPTAAGRAFAS
jgi:hypothetical protein